MSLMVFLRECASRLGRLISKAQLSLVIALCALSVSLAQFYYGYLFDRSELLGFASNFVYSRDVAERDGKMRFSFRSNITISLVNSGNRPSALLGMYLVFPLGFDRDCTAVPGTDSDVLGAGGLFGSLYGFNANYHRYSSAATSLAPGAISIIDGTFVIEEAFREKADLGRDKPLCLMFNALDHEGKLFRTTISAGTFKIFENTSGYNISSSLLSAINLMPRR